MKGHMATCRNVTDAFYSLVNMEVYGADQSDPTEFGSRDDTVTLAYIVLCSFVPMGTDQKRRVQSGQ